MEFNNPGSLVTTLRHPDLRVRVGLWLQPLSLMATEADEAARLTVQSVDIRDEFLQTLPAGARFVHLDEGHILELLDSLSQRTHFGDCALIYNLDLLLAALTHGERTSIWEFLLTGLPWRKSALLLTLPNTASRLAPSEIAGEAWRAANRLAVSE